MSVPARTIWKRISVLRAARIVLGVMLLCGFGLTVRPLWAGEPGQESGELVHVVRFGETLSEIAQSYGLSMAEIMDYNRIGDPDTILVGQALAIPATKVMAAGDDVGGAPGVTASAASIASLNRVVTVGPGDTLGWIALRYGVDQEALRAVNRLQPGESIRIGETLILPATDDDLRVTSPAQMYTVRPGDSLGLIAQRFGVSLGALMTANRILNPDTIHPGQKLTVPGLEKEAPQVHVGPARSGFLYHRVQPGETMSELAQIYNTTPQAIVRYNNLPDEETLFSGLEIRIPYGPPKLNRRTPPAPRSGTEFVISITRQRCWVLRNARVVYEWKCSTGQGQWATRTGTFPIKTKLEMAQSSAYRLDMPFWLGLYDVGDFENGIHGLPVDWGTGQKLWDELVGQPATFGCAMLLDKDAATLFSLSYIGMPVHIVD